MKKKIYYILYITGLFLCINQGNLYGQDVTLNWSSTTFNESDNNDGTFTFNIDVVISGSDEFNKIEDAGFDIDGIPEDYVKLGYASVTNVPEGLRMVIDRINEKRVRISLKDTSFLHEEEHSISNMNVTFNSSAFVNEDTTGYEGLSATISINFDNYEPITDSDFEFVLSELFEESEEDNGFVNGSVILELVGGDSLAGNIGDDLIKTGYADALNTPEGLVLKIIKETEFKVKLSLSGNAINHDNSDDTSMGWSFRDSAFLNVDADVVDYSSFEAGIQIDFHTEEITNIDDSDFLIITQNPFLENETNDGSIVGSIIMSLTGGDTLSGTWGTNLVSLGLVTPINIPTGLSLSVLKVNSTEVNITLEGYSDLHAFSDSVTFGWIFSDNAFANVTSDKVDFAIHPQASLISFFTEDLPTIRNSDFSIQSSSLFKEDVKNDGSVNGEITLHLSGGDSLTGTDGEDFIKTGKLISNSLPDGLTMQAVRLNNFDIQITIHGIATNHATAIHYFGWNFNNTAFKNVIMDSVDYASVRRHALTFHDGYNPEVTITTSNFNNGTTFNEVTPYTGGLGNAQIQLRLSYDTFVDSIHNYVSLSNLPEGLTYNVTRNTNHLISINFFGNASFHTPNDSEDISVLFADGAFSNYPNTEVANYTSNYNIAFQNYHGIDFPVRHVTENIINNGAINEELKISLLGGEHFNGSIGEDFVSTSKINIEGVPNGLFARVVKESDSTLQMFFIGKAVSHNANTDNVTLNITFQTTAFDNTSMLEFDGTIINDFEIRFVDIPTIPTFAYQTKEFVESKTNDGNIEPGFIVSLFNCSFNDSLSSENLIIENLNPDYTYVFKKVTDTQAHIDILGTTDEHFNVNDRDSIKFTFTDSTHSVIDNKEISEVANNTFYGNIDYFDREGFYWTDLFFSENIDLHDGSVLGTAFVKIGGGNSFVGNIGDNIASHLNVANLPSGLSFKLEKVTEYSAILSLDGQAVEHQAKHSRYDVSFEILSSAMTDSMIDNYIDKTVYSIAIEFVDTYGLNWSRDSFIEKYPFNGTIEDSLLVTTIGSAKFVEGENLEFITNNYISFTNLPDSLVPNIDVISSDSLYIFFTDTAKNHLKTNDINDLIITFNADAFVNDDITKFENLSKTFSIDFNDPAPFVVWSSTTFVETEDYNGELEGEASIFIDGDSLLGEDGSTISNFTIQNLPSGLTALLTKVNDFEFTVHISGNAISHEETDDVNNIIITLEPGVFRSEDISEHISLSNIETPFAIDFRDNPVTSGSLEENASVDFISNQEGSVSGYIYMRLDGGDTFSASNGQDLVELGLVTPLNIPDGLTLNIRQQTPTLVYIYLSGFAKDLSTVVTQIGWTFLDEAFTNLTAPDVTNSNLEEGPYIRFSDPTQTIFDGANWSNGTPNATKNVLIREGVSYDIATTVLVKTLILEENARINIQANGGLIINDDLVSEGVIDIVNGSYLLQTDNSNYLGSGTINYYISGSRHELVYGYYSAPVVSQTVFGENIFTYDPRIPSNNSISELNDGWINSTAMVMDPGVGYIATNVFDQTISGVPNNGEIIVSVYKGSFSDFNLLGNPYPSGVNLNDFITANADLLNSTLYFWDQSLEVGEGYNNGDYATYKPGIGGVSGGSGKLPNGHLSTGQGFFVKAKSNGNVIFNNSMRSQNNTQFFAEITQSRLIDSNTEEENTLERLWLNITNNSDQFNQLLIAFKEEATDGFEEEYDAKKFKGNNTLSFYSLDNSNIRYSINVQPLLTSSSTNIDLGLQTETSGYHQFSIPKMNFNNLHQEIYLLDKYQNKEYRIDNGSVNLYIESGTYEDRFVLSILDNSSILSLAQEENLLKVGTSTNHLHIFSSNLISNLKVFDLNGILRLDLKNIQNQQKIAHNLLSGIYILQIEDGDELVTVKVVLN